MARPTNRLSLIFNSDEDISDGLPECVRLLCIAVIRRAVLDLRAKHTKAQRLAALRFINDDGEDEFSFGWLCDTIGLNADSVRHQIRTILDTNLINDIKNYSGRHYRRYQVSKKIREKRNKKNHIVCSSFIGDTQNAKSVFV